MADPKPLAHPIDKFDEKWSEAITIQKNDLLGKHFVAARPIKKGELVMEERPILASACITASPCKPIWEGFETKDVLPICLSCGMKHLDGTVACSRCKWPVCNSYCESDPLHLEGECPIFVRNSILPSNLTILEYSAVTVLRALLLGKNDPMKWQKFQELEPHMKNRSTSATDRQELDFINHFIREVCNLPEFDAKTIDRTMGILTVNAYWAFPYLGKCMTLLFDKGCFFAHDCDPNTERKIIEKVVKLDSMTRKEIFLKVNATRDIHQGESITISYIPHTHKSNAVEERQKYLNNYFYFNCGCNRCLRELKMQTKARDDKWRIPIEM